MMNIDPGPLERLVDEEHITIMKNGQKVMEFFKTDDDSRNSFILTIITLGEGWHNNHHRYMGSARQGFYWWEIDLTYYGLKLMSKLGLIWDLKPVPRSVYQEAQPN
jgi:fatty-acid desaturase